MILVRHKVCSQGWRTWTCLCENIQLFPLLTHEVQRNVVFQDCSRGRAHWNICLMTFFAAVFRLSFRCYRFRQLLQSNTHKTSNKSSPHSLLHWTFWEHSVTSEAFRRYSGGGFRTILAVSCNETAVSISRTRITSKYITAWRLRSADEECNSVDATAAKPTRKKKKKKSGYFRQ
jgi:hypothetical protein